MDDIFHIISKITIVLPITAIIGAFLIKAGGGTSPKSTALFPSPTSEKKQVLQMTESHSSTSAQLNLDGPLVCNYSNSDVVLDAFVKEKKIAFKLEENLKIKNFLYRDDCLYIWDNGNFSGEKICGLGKYVQIADSLMATKLLDFNGILGNLAHFGNLSKSVGSTENLKNLADSCKREEIKNESVFNIPKNVLFKNKEVKNLP